MHSSTEIIVEAWRDVAHYIAHGHAAEFEGDLKERLVFRRLGTEIERIASFGRTDLEVPFHGRTIDLVYKTDLESISVEGKYKITRDGAFPHNRKAAFFDLYKLEKYIDAGEYSSGLFLWLTNVPAYPRPASAPEFSTHHGRVYQAGMPLDDGRTSRNPMPRPLILTRSFVFEWEKIGDTNWHYLVLTVGKRPRVHGRGRSPPAPP